MSFKADRRNFIKKSGLIAGGILAVPGVLSSAFSPKREVVKLGVIGTGDRGGGILNLVKSIPGFKVTAVADPIDFRLKDRGLARAPEAKGYRNHEELLDKADVEAVVIATPFSTHDEVALAAMDAGKHVYCEKTMVKGMSEIQAVIDKAKSSGVVFQTGHQYHSSPLYQRALEIIRNGYIGDVTAYHCQWNRNGDWRRAVPRPELERQINWRMYREFSGGLIAELCSHQIDFINWVTQSHPAKFSGFGGIDYWKDGRETFDNIHLLCEYPDGLDASFTCTTTNGYEDYKIKVLGKKATLILDYTKGMIYAEDTQKEKGLVDGVSGATLDAWKQGLGIPIDAPGNDPTQNALEQFYESIAHDAPVISDIKTGATTAKCVHIGLDALHQGGVKYWTDYPELHFG